jgi:sugar phosphate isomerase/epimerase
MKIGCSSWSFRKAFESRKLDLLRFVELAPELGLDGIELLSGDFPSVSPRFLSELSARLAHLPIEISAVSVSNDFSCEDAAERLRQCEDVCAWCALLRDLGVRYLRTFTGYLHGSADVKQAKAWVYECYEQVLPAAERTNVTLAVENHSSVMSSAEELVELVWHFGSSCLQLNPDPTNFLPGYRQKSKREREAVYRSLETVARFAVHSHLKVQDLDDRGGPAHVDVPRLLAIYQRACYDGYLSIEYAGGGEPEAVVRKAAGYLRTLTRTCASPT